MKIMMENLNILQSFYKNLKAIDQSCKNCGCNRYLLCSGDHIIDVPLEIFLDSTAQDWDDWSQELFKIEKKFKVKYPQASGKGKKRNQPKRLPLTKTCGC